MEFETQPPDSGEQRLTPQRWGFLPTNAFWNQVELRPLHKALVIGVVVASAAISQLLGHRLFPGLATPVSVVALVVAVVLSQGLLERHLRRLRRTFGEGLRSPP